MDHEGIDSVRMLTSSEATVAAIALVGYAHQLRTLAETSSDAQAQQWLEDADTAAKLAGDLTACEVLLAGPAD